MAKRFTETNKWRDSWYRKLPPTLKLGWLYLYDNCDAAGVIDLDTELANFQIGMNVEWDELVASSEGRVKPLANGRLWLTKFVEFQYGALSESCGPHKAVLKLVEKHKLKHQTLAQGSSNPSVRVPERVQVQEKEKEKGGAGGKRFTPPTVVEVSAYCEQRRNHVNPQQFVDHYTSNGWRVGKNSMRDWQAAVRTWEKNGVGARVGSTEKEPEYRQVSLVVFNAHAAHGDFKIGPKKVSPDGHSRVYGTLKSGRKIESNTDPDWEPKH